jgi:hypothetical protein
MNILLEEKEKVFRGHCLVSWPKPKVRLLKKHGGLEIRDLKTQNISLFFKMVMTTKGKT